MTPEQVTQIADAINGVKSALEFVAYAVFAHVLLGGPSLGGVRQALDGIARALRERR